MLSLIFNLFLHCLWHPLGLHTPAADQWWGLRESYRWDVSLQMKSLENTSDEEERTHPFPWPHQSQTRQTDLSKLSLSKLANCIWPLDRPQLDIMKLNSSAKLRSDACVKGDRGSKIFCYNW